MKRLPSMIGEELDSVPLDTPCGHSSADVAHDDPGPFNVLP